MDCTKKSFFYSEGLIEGAETIILFILMFVFYELASLIASIFALLCFFPRPLMRATAVVAILMITRKWLRKKKL